MTKEESEKEQTAVETKKQLCPYAAVGECRYGENCVYLHGDSCDMCGLQVLHPMDAAQRSQHIKVSLKEDILLIGVRTIFSLSQHCQFISEKRLVNWMVIIIKLGMFSFLGFLTALSSKLCFRTSDFGLFFLFLSSFLK